MLRNRVKGDRPIDNLQSGWIDERVEMSDWLEPVGEIGVGSTWAEIQASTPDHLTLKLTNPTRYSAKVKLLAESSTKAVHPLGQNYLWGCRIIEISPGDVAIIQQSLLEFKGSFVPGA